jgi:hypothetical protein
MSRLTRSLRLAVLVGAFPAFGQSVTVTLPPPLPPPPMPSVTVVAPQPVIVRTAPVTVAPAPTTVVVQQEVAQPGKGNRGKHKGQRK